MAIMQNRQVNEYAKSDFDFSRAKSVLRGAYLLALIILVLALLSPAIAEVRGGEGMSAVLMLIFMPFLFHVGYSFMVGFFEIVRHLREIRNELVALRLKAVLTQQPPVQPSQAGASSLRYDSATHQYVKNS